MNQLELDMLNKIFKKRAVLFAGAGFSVDAANFDAKMPTAKTLSHIICDLMKMEHDDNLRDISDYFFYNYCKNNNVIIEEYCEKMKHLFTIKNAPEYYDQIINVPWKRIYTTNYDDLIEFLGKRNNKLITSFSLNDSNNNTLGNICLHINGNIYDLKPSNYDTALKVSSSSYISPDDFTTSSWFSTFINDIETSSCIVFIGYSLYDLNIEKILYKHPNLKNKIYFIQKSDISEIDKFKLEKYGKVLSISTEGFSTLLKEYINQYGVIDEEFYTTSYAEFSIDTTNNIINNDIIDNVKDKFLMHGKLDNKYYYLALVKPNYSPIMVIRSQLDEALIAIKERQYLIITGNLGNGKTVFLLQIMTKLFMEGEHVFYLLYGNDIVLCKQEIDKIQSQNYTSYIIIDSYSKHMKIVEYIIENNYNNIKLILADRTIEFQHNMPTLSGKKYQILDVEQLDSREISAFYNILNNSYMWNEKLKKLGYYKRKEYLKHDCKGEISLILTDILESENIRHKINDTVKNIMNDASSKYILFVICILNVLDIRIYLAILNYILEDYNYKIFDNTDLYHFFQYDIFSKQINVKSSIFSSYILSHIFDSQYVLSKCIKLLEKLETNCSYKHDYMIVDSIDRLKVELFRFNFIESILSETNKLNNLTAYYSEIQSIIPNVTSNPQYWLQYAMCFIAYNDKFDKGQKYLTKAYECAKNTKYDMHKIDN